MVGHVVRVRHLQHRQNSDWVSLLSRLRLCGENITTVGEWCHLPCARKCYVQVENGLWTYGVTKVRQYKDSLQKHLNDILTFDLSDCENLQAPAWFSRKSFSVNCVT